MDINKFVADFAELFDDTDSSEIQVNTKFHELEEWGSLIGMGLIAMAKTQYNKSISGKDIRDCETVMDLFKMITSR